MNGPIETKFRSIDGLSIRYAESDNAGHFASANAADAYATIILDRWEKGYEKA
jgi:hypothetical protein